MTTFLVLNNADPSILQFEISLYSETSERAPVKELVRSKITPQIRDRLQKLGPALIAEHGKDLQHAPGSNPSSGFSTPKYIESSSINKGTTGKPTSSSAAQSSTQSYSVNVTTVTDETEFRTTASELYTTFTDPQRITAFTRSAPLVFDGAKPGGRFELFGGNVSGEYAVLEEPTKIVQKWRLAQWPQGHYSTLKIRFEQNDVDAVTLMRVDWEGVPVGQEDVTKRNWGEYYVRSIKTTFGFGTVL
jgi:activator of HSP90 ATPase